jgi:NADH-ubiquinone oxidoreductase chain 2
LISIILGSLLGLAQTRIKRLLAYSSVSHIGFMLLCISVGSLSAYTAFSLYLVQYSLTTLNMFLILLGLGFLNQNRSSYKDLLNISQLRYLFSDNPLLAVSIAICLFSMAGVPFLIGFFAKYEVLVACLNSQYSIMALIAIVMSVISAGYYLNIIQLAFAFNNEPRNPINRVIYTNSLLAYSISFLSLILLTYIINPAL